jgi:hypothetical protein
MSMTAEQRSQAEQFLKEKMRGVCPSCGHREFEIADLVTMLPYEAGVVVLSPHSIPVLLIVCKNCLHIAPFAAVPMGLIPTGIPAASGAE